MSNDVKNDVKNSVKNGVKNGVKNSVVKRGGGSASSARSSIAIPRTLSHAVLHGPLHALLHGSLHAVPKRTIVASVLALTFAVGPIDAQLAPVRVPRSVLQRYAGEYDQNGTIIKVYVRGDTLYREIPGQRIAYTPITETLFRMGPVFTAEFVIDQAGGVTQVLTDGVAIEFRLPRKGSRPGPPPAPPVASVRVPRSVLEQYVGTYEYIPGQMSRTDLRVVVRLKGDTLIRSMGQESILTPISETRFKVGNTSLVTEFVIDEAGVTQIMGSGFQQMLARLTSKR